MLSFKDKKVLIIDDFLQFSHTLRDMLSYFNFKAIHTAITPDEALAQMKVHQHDVVLCDYHLGDQHKNGQNILEDVNHYNLQKPGGVFVMMFRFKPAKFGSWGFGKSTRSFFGQAF